MESEHFGLKDLLRSLAASPTRRSIARAVAGFALAGPLSTLLGLENAAAKKKKRKKKKKKCKGNTKKCGKRCIPTTNCCRAAECGAGGICTGGGCLCSVGFTTCEGKCIPDTACCTAGDCGVCERCQDGSCLAGCPDGQECVSGQCRCTTNSCDGCCGGDACQSGESNGACGKGGEQCVVCTNGRNCQDGGHCVCPTRCCDDSDCGPGNLCIDGHQCVTGSGTCSPGDDFCTGEIVFCNDSSCACATDGQARTRCSTAQETFPICNSDAECASLGAGAFCRRAAGSCTEGRCRVPCSVLL